jgi:hypothetical protein
VTRGAKTFYQRVYFRHGHRARRDWLPARLSALVPCSLCCIHEIKGAGDKELVKRFVHEQ